MPTLVLNPKGFVQSYWGQRDFTDVPVEEDVLTFVKNLREFYMQNVEFMCYGNMVKPLAYETGLITFSNEMYARSYTTEEVLSTAYEFDGKKIQIFVNYNTEDKTVVVNGAPLTIKALSVAKIDV
jgi:hypothetical protein